MDDGRGDKLTSNPSLPLKNEQVQVGWKDSWRLMGQVVPGWVTILTTGLPPGEFVDKKIITRHLIVEFYCLFCCLILLPLY